MTRRKVMKANAQVVRRCFLGRGASYCEASLCYVIMFWSLLGLLLGAFVAISVSLGRSWEVLGALGVCFGRSWGALCSKAQRVASDGGQMQEQHQRATTSRQGSKEASKASG